MGKEYAGQSCQEALFTLIVEPDFVQLLVMGASAIGQQSQSFSCACGVALEHFKVLAFEQCSFKLQGR